MNHVNPSEPQSMLQTLVRQVILRPIALAIDAQSSFVIKMGCHRQLPLFSQQDFQQLVLASSSSFAQAGITNSAGLGFQATNSNSGTSLPESRIEFNTSTA